MSHARKELVRWGRVKIKNFCSVTDSFKRMERQARDRKYLQNTYLEKDLNPKYTKKS